MKVRIITRGTASRATVTALCCATLTIVISALVSACTSSPGNTAPSIFSPPPASARTHTGTATQAGTATHAGTASATATPRHTVPATSTERAPASHGTTTAPAQPGHTPTPARTRFPTGAPATGGGGTAGLRDGLLFGLGAAAILAGLAGLAYRRRLNRSS